jgi:hypothetical protein
MRRRQITGFVTEGKRRIPSRAETSRPYLSAPPYPALTSNFAHLTTNSAAILIFCT